MLRFVSIIPHALNNCVIWNSAYGGENHKNGY